MKFLKIKLFLMLTALLIASAVGFNDVKAAKPFLHRSKISKKCSLTEEQKLHRDLTEAMFKAYWNKDFESMAMFIESGADPNSPRIGTHEMILCAAVKYAHYQGREATEVLLNHGANPNIKDFSWRTPLCYAILQEDFEAVRILFQRGADVNMPCNHLGQTPLQVAISRERLDMARFLISLGASVNNRAEFCYSPLQMAVLCRNKFDMIKLLVDSGADLNAKNKFGGSVMHFALQNAKSSEDVLEFLTENGAQ